MGVAVGVIEAELLWSDSMDEATLFVVVVDPVPPPPPLLLPPLIGLLTRGNGLRAGTLPRFMSFCRRNSSSNRRFGPLPYWKENVENWEFVHTKKRFGLYNYKWTLIDLELFPSLYTHSRLFWHPLKAILLSRHVCQISLQHCLLYHKFNPKKKKEILALVVEKCTWYAKVVSSFEFHFTPYSG